MKNGTRSQGRDAAHPVRTRLPWLPFMILLLFSVPALAQQAGVPGLPAFTSTPGPGGSTTYTLAVETLLLLTALTFIPALLLMMTSFTRIIIVLGLLRHALGTQTSPPNQVIVGLALFLTFFIMAPVTDRIYEEAYRPLAADEINFTQALDRASAPLKTFMLKQTRESDIALFARLAKVDSIEAPEETPMRVLVPAYTISELKTAFQIGFIIYIPFLVIDIAVASILMSMGMMMMSPVMVSLPIKIMLFVLADGWNLIMGALVRSFSA